MKHIIAETNFASHISAKHILYVKQRAHFLKRTKRVFGPWFFTGAPHQNNSCRGRGRLHTESDADSHPPEAIHEILSLSLSFSFSLSTGGSQPPSITRARPLRCNKVRETTNPFCKSKLKSHVACCAIRDSAAHSNELFAGVATARRTAQPEELTSCPHSFAYAALHCHTFITTPLSS